MGKIVVYDTLDDELLNKWHTLWQISENGHFFNTPEWLLSYLAVQNVPYTIITIEEREELVAVLPLVKEKLFGVPVLRSPGGKFLNKSSLLMKTYAKSLVKELISYLMEYGNFALQELGSDLADTIASIDNNLVKRKASLNPYLPLTSDPFQYLSSKNRSQIRGILRKNEQELTYKSSVGDRNALEMTFELDNRSRKRQQGKATFVSEEDKAFCLELIQRMPQRVSVEFVSYKEIPVVYSIGFIYKNIYHAFNTAFDAEYRFLRPGKILAYLRIQELAKNGFVEFDFGRGNSVLKQEFTDVARIQYDIYYSKNTITRSLWKMAYKAYTTVEDNKRLYSIYLSAKKTFLR